MAKPRVVILGAGPAGVGAAYQLRRHDRAEVTVVEQFDRVGGNAGSFDANGQRVDYGSHRLHPACDPSLLEDIGELLGDDLLNRPRHGRIRLMGKWIHFPLRPLDLLVRLDRSFAFGSLRDRLPMGKKPREGAESFASVLRDGLGETICNHFYFPYARKIWGQEPEALSEVQAKRRVSAGSFLKLLRKVFRMPGGGRRGMGARFYYPRQGFGQISDAYAAAAADLGAQLSLNWTVSRLEPPRGEMDPWRIEGKSGTETQTLEADHVWSTIPVTLVARFMNPSPPAAVSEAASKLEYRAMALVYLQLPVERFSEYDAHYFPEGSVRITRLSEPKNYVDEGHPAGRTTLCAELPLSVEEALWEATDEELAELVAQDLATAGIPLPCSPDWIHVRRIRQAYPIYLQGYQDYFETLDAWAAGLPRFLSFGRQGLFAHDNTHHTLHMAYSAVECLGPDGFDDEKWDGFRALFAEHVVED